MKQTVFFWQYFSLHLFVYFYFGISFKVNFFISLWQRPSPRARIMILNFHRIWIENTCSEQDNENFKWILSKKMVGLVWVFFFLRIVLLNDRVTWNTVSCIKSHDALKIGLFTLWYRPFLFILVNLCGNTIMILRLSYRFGWKVVQLQIPTCRRESFLILLVLQRDKILFRPIAFSRLSTSLPIVHIYFSQN